MIFYGTLRFLLTEILVIWLILIIALLFSCDKRRENRKKCKHASIKNNKKET